MNAEASRPVAVTVTDAARLAGVSPSVIRRAIHATDPREWPPPLKAHRKGTAPTAAYLIRTADLDEWVSSMPTA